MQGEPSQGLVVSYRNWTSVRRAIWVVCTLSLTWSCKPRPVAEIPSISGEKEPDRADRDTPDGSTIILTLELLEPRGTDTDRLDQQRAEFGLRIRTLLPKEADRADSGISTLIRWHELYTRRLREHQRALNAAARQAASILKPARGHRVTVTDLGVVQDCWTDAKSPSPRSEPQDAEAAELAPQTVCEARSGFQQFQFQLGAAEREIGTVLEAQWHLLKQLERVRVKLSEQDDRRSTEDASP